MLQQKKTRQNLEKSEMNSKIKQRNKRCLLQKKCELKKKRNLETTTQNFKNKQKKLIQMNLTNTLTGLRKG